MTTFTIKGLYLNSKKENPTYFGTLRDCMRYVDNNGYKFLKFGESIQICIGDDCVAIKECVKEHDEIGDYWEYKEWVYLW